ncbi:MAG: glycosyltransferase family 4 protein [Polyangiaceae bacterium]|jgi:glycosyltransferase involved in cell wall biosynthesis
MIRVLHLTAHLGGGVGRALAALVEQTEACGLLVRHEFVCFEDLEKTLFADQIRAAGGTVDIRPDPSTLARRMESADVVQLEFWNHPSTMGALCALPPLEARLLVWCHVSGLRTPVVPPRLIDLAHRFVFTSACSLESPALRRLPSSVRERIDVVSSSGGFGHVSGLRDGPTGKLKLGYVGSLHFSKMHPHYVDWVSGIDAAVTPIRMIGDPVNQIALEAQARARGRPDLLEFRGYCPDVAAELRQLDVLVYLLNPKHYGTTENALLEAMAMGVVPITLDNPAERTIVRHGETGLVVRTAEELANAIGQLAADPRAAARMGRAAAYDVRSRFDPVQTARRFAKIYGAVADEDRHALPFEQIFGLTAADRFRSCLSEPARFPSEGGVRLSESETDRAALFDRTKGSAFHFHAMHPDDASLARWVEELDAAS